MTAGGGRRGAAATRGGPRQRPQPREPPRGQTEPPGPLGLHRSGAVACAAIKRRVRPAVRRLTLSYRIFVKGWRYLPAARMDSEVQRDGRILDLIDDAWREDKLPYEDVAIPLNELPEPEQDNGGTTESVKEQEMKWTDLALQYLHENVPPTGN